MSICTTANKEDKISQFLQLLRDPEVKSFFDNYIENILATSELKILKRISALESKLGLNDMDTEEELTIPEQLSRLADRIDNTNLIVKEPVETVQATATYTGMRAQFLMKHLEKDIGANDFGELEVKSRDFRTFIENVIPDKYRTMNTTNMRQLKKQVFEIAVKLFPEKVFIHRSLGGNRETSLVFRKRNKCN